MSYDPATTAILLSILGLFGALSDAVRQRRREFAVRIALGAQRRHVIWQVLKDGARLAFDEPGWCAECASGLTLAGPKAHLARWGGGDGDGDG